jgi:hypothetical protein
MRLPVAARAIGVAASDFGFILVLKAIAATGL